ncbi:hypothetical protein L1F30_08245 [Simiduia sp. 21SJ11W-1]|uniref:hypothetical protein n=1 Tax=Simiduia sp. 21SJ11W-1 TaxID=2909669 RepID=UPI00209DA612|nr:hypothetical protein [Simiduia sp. 21SJ11W-1]UTA49514.1 hypothetical protein L1F30_08245 [Simiduia sp. 21SJ11W-1]
MELKRSEHTARAGKSLDPSVFSSITPGTTDKQWLLRYLGHPDQVIELGGGKQQFLYKVEHNEKKSLRVFLLFEQRADKTTPHWYVVELMGEKVVDAWQKTPALPPQVKPEVPQESHSEQALDVAQSGTAATGKPAHSTATTSATTANQSAPLAAQPTAIVPEGGATQSKTPAAQATEPTKPGTE